MELLAFPFSLRPNGTVVTVTQDSDAANVQLIAALVLTRYGERELLPGFGTSDPAMFGLQPTELAAQVAQWGPAVTITNVTQAPTSPDVTSVQIDFD